MLLNFFSQISKISNLPFKNDDGKKIISLASHKNKRYPSLPPSSLYPNSTEKFSAWTHHGNGDVSRIIRHCDARVSERASARKRGGGERKRLEMYLGICRPTEVTQDDGFGDGFWVRGGRQAGGYWNRVVALTVRPTYDSPSSLLPSYLCLSDGTAIENRPVMLAWDSFERNFRIACSFCTREQWAKRGEWHVIHKDWFFETRSLSRVKFKFRSFLECLALFFLFFFFIVFNFFFWKWTNGINAVIGKTMGWKIC